MDKPSGCIIWILVTPELKFDFYLWLGGPPGQALPDIQDMRVVSQVQRNCYAELNIMVPLHLRPQLRPGRSGRCAAAPVAGRFAGRFLIAIR